MGPEAPPRQHYGLTFSILAVGAIGYSLLQSLVIPALPVIQKELGASETAVAWVLTAYLLSASVCTPILGRLGDMYGKERLLVIVFATLALGTFVSAIATSMPLLIAGRVIQGAGGGIFPLAFGIIRDEFPEERVAGGIGLMSSLLGIGGGLGVVLAGPIVNHLSYHWLFWFPLIATLIAMVATLLWIPESPVKVPGRVNWLAGTLMSLGLAGTLLAVSQTTTWGWASVRVWTLFAIGCVLLVLWVRTELRADEPLVDMRMMRIRGVWTTNLVAFLLGVGMYSSFVLVPQYVQEPKSTGYGFGASIVASGLYLLPSTMAMVVMGQLAGRLERRFGSRALLSSGTAFAAVAFGMLSIARSQPWEILLATTLMGVGIGLAFAATANLIVENVTPEQTGVATGMNTVTRTLGGALGGQIAATFLSQFTGFAGRPTDHAFTLAFGMCSIALAVALAACALIPARRRAIATPRPEFASGS
jgi:EmrB/QacA subfamily drug resistance transporter